MQHSTYYDHNQESTPAALKVDSEKVGYILKALDQAKAAGHTKTISETIEMGITMAETVEEVAIVCLTLGKSLCGTCPMKSGALKDVIGIAILGDLLNDLLEDNGPDTEE